MENVREFVKFVKSQCRQHNIKFRLRPTKSVVISKAIRCSGYFDENTRELVVAGKNKRWLEILVHEYGHLTQWVDNCKEWRDLGNSIEKVDSWLEGKRVKDVKKALALTRDLELDNEKRSVKIIKEWGLPIDIKEYTQKANAYVNLYNRLAVTRKWPSVKNSPYKNPKIYKQMPKIFRMDYKNLSEKYYKIFEEAGL